MPAGVTAFPAALDTLVTLIDVRDQGQTTLTAGVDDNDTTLPVSNTSTLPSSSVVTIAGEHVIYTGKTADSLTGCTRGVFTSDGGSAAAPHDSGTSVEGLIIAAGHRVQSEAIIATQTKLGAGADTPADGEFLVGSGAGTSEWRAGVKADVGLGNADNTSDANKPVSTAQQTALNLKANLASPTFTGTVGGITKAMVGLGNVDNTSDANKPVSTAQAAAIDALAPPGCIQMYAAATAPTGWLLCDGAAVSRATFADLFALIGTTYGAGNGSTTFNVPNFKSRMPFGLDSAQTENNALGEVGGARDVTLLATQSGIRAHTHFAGTLATASDGAHTHNYTRTQANGSFSANGVNHTAVANDTFATTSAGAHTHDITGDTAANSAANASASHENMSPFLTVNFIIKH